MDLTLRFDLRCSRALENFLPPTSEDKKAYRIDAQRAGRETSVAALRRRDPELCWNHGIRCLRGVCL